MAGAVEECASELVGNRRVSVGRRLRHLGCEGSLLTYVERRSMENNENSIDDSINGAYSKKLNIHELKNWAKENLPRTSQVRGILLLEKDVLPVGEFIVKMDTWLKLIDMETHTLN